MQRKNGELPFPQLPHELNTDIFKFFQRPAEMHGIALVNKESFRLTQERAKSLREEYKERFSGNTFYTFGNPICIDYNFHKILEKTKPPYLFLNQKVIDSFTLQNIESIKLFKTKVDAETYAHYFASNHAKESNTLESNDWKQNPILKPAIFEVLYLGDRNEVVLKKQIETKELPLFRVCSESEYYETNRCHVMPLKGEIELISPVGFFSSKICGQVDYDHLNVNSAPEAEPNNKPNEKPTPKF